MAACTRIFRHITFVGRTEADTEALLGPPDHQEGNHLDYMRHNGEVGCSHTLTVENGVVAGVRENMTQ